MSTLDDYLMQEIRNIDVSEIVRGEVYRQIGDEIKRQIAKAVRDGVDKIVLTEIEIVMSKPVETDDGWGKRAKYASFEELFKKEFREKLDNNWDMKRILEKAVKDRVEELFKKSYADVTKKITDEMTNQ